MNCSFQTVIKLLAKLPTRSENVTYSDFMAFLSTEAETKLKRAKQPSMKYVRRFFLLPFLTEGTFEHLAYIETAHQNYVFATTALMKFVSFIWL